jgi:hypothetical protein
MMTRMMAVPITFVAHYPDGSEFTEAQGVWDDVPRDRPLVALSLRWADTGEEIVKLAGARRYYFSNEAIAVFGVDAVGHLSAKIIGMETLEGVDEVRLDLIYGRAEQNHYAPGECPFIEAAFRQGYQGDAT